MRRLEPAHRIREALLQPFGLGGLTRRPGGNGLEVLDQRLERAPGLGIEVLGAGELRPDLPHYGLQLRIGHREAHE